MKTGKMQMDDRSIKAATQGLLGLLDYAIAEGSELQRPLFVLLLKLARLALLEGEDVSFRSIGLVSMHDDD